MPSDTVLKKKNTRDVFSARYTVFSAFQNTWVHKRPLTHTRIFTQATTLKQERRFGDGCTHHLFFKKVLITVHNYYGIGTQKR